MSMISECLFKTNMGKFGIYDGAYLANSRDARHPLTPLTCYSLGKSWASEELTVKIKLAQVCIYKVDSGLCNRMGIRFLLVGQFQWARIGVARMT